MERLTLHRVNKSFGNKTVLKDLYYDFDDGVYYITGENGS